MYLRADQLAGVVRLFEVLRMKCGVSVSKMVAVEERTKGGGRTRDAIKCCREIHFSDLILNNNVLCSSLAQEVNSHGQNFRPRIFPRIGLRIHLRISLSIL